MARGDFIEEHPEDLRRFAAGWLKGVEMANANPASTAALLAKSFSGIGLEDAKGMLEDVKLPTYAENRAFFSGEGSLANYQSIYKTVPGHLAAHRQDQGRLRALPDGGHALPGSGRGVLPRGSGRRRQAGVRVQDAAQAARPPRS